ncbi:MAG: TonB family protein [Saprospiraceae bacterium]
MSESKHTSWSTLLRRWFSGDATRNDERELEVLAKDDPFVAEAMEGYRALPDDDHALAVTHLKVRLRQHYGKKRRGVVFYAVRAAAAGAVLVAAWMVLQQVNQSAIGGRDMAEAEKKVAPLRADTVFNSSESVAPETVETVRDVAAGQPKELQPEPIEQPSPNEPAPSNVEADEAYQSEPVPVVVSAGKAPAADSAAGFREKEELAAGVTMQDEVAAAHPIPPAERKVSARHISGRVTGANGEPLIGASILDKGNGQGTVTDINGGFSMEVGDSSTTLTITHTGYESREVQLGADSSVEVQLEDDAEQLQEVAVTGLSARKAKRRDARTSAAPAAPSPKGGFRKFKRYLRKNLRYPETAVQNGVEGTVRLRFRVADGGRPTDFEVLDSLGAGCDAEAIRLLKEGPKWAPPGVAVYSIKFKL